MIEKMNFNEIVESTDYDKLKTLPYNRPVVSSHLNRLMSDIFVNGYDKRFPIIVTKEYEIIDGQHRFEACKSLKIPFYYQIIKCDESEKKVLVKRFNEIKKNWSIEDYLKYYENTEILRILNNAKNNLNLNSSGTLKLLSYFIKKEDGTRSSLNVTKFYEYFRIGENVEIHPSFFDFLRDLSIFLSVVDEINPNNIKDWKRHLRTIGFTSSFLTLWSYKNFSLDFFIEKIKQKGSLFTHTRSREAWKETFVQIYNYRNFNSKIRINFRGQIVEEEAIE